MLDYYLFPTFFFYLLFILYLFPMFNILDELFQFLKLFLMFQMPRSDDGVQWTHVFDEYLPRFHPQ